MWIKALIQDEFLGFILVSGKRLGKKAPLNTPVEIGDEYSEHPAFLALKNAVPARIGIVAFGQDGQHVSRTEFEDLQNGLYKATGVAAGATVTGPFTPAEVVAAVTEPYDLRLNWDMRFKIDDIYNVLVTIPVGIYTSAGLAATLNAIPDFAKHLVASDAAGSLTVTAKSVGVDSMIEVVFGHANDANDYIQLPVTPAVGTGTPEVITVTVIGPTGKPLQLAPVVLGIYTLAVAGALVATAKLQVLSKGSYSVGLYSNTATFYTNEEGKIEFEVIDLAAGPVTIYLDIVAPTDYFLASVPASRLAVSVA